MINTKGNCTVSHNILVTQIKTQKSQWETRKTKAKSESAQKHVCTECEKEFSTSTNLKRHMQLHTGQFRYFCQSVERDTIATTLTKRTWTNIKEYNIDASFVPNRLRHSRAGITIFQYTLDCIALNVTFV